MLFDGTTAIGVEYLDGPHLYRADPRSDEAPAPAGPVQAYADREVILAGGAFNTPQLLQLSGVGPRAELDRLGIPVLVDSPGVGANLQDRYEVGVVSQLRRDFDIFAGAGFDVPKPGVDDPLYDEWERRDGPYTTNGSLAAYLRRSSVAGVDPDLFVFALPISFRGYYPGYADDFTNHFNRLTWTVLKAHTNNRAGTVRLRSADPRDTPLIAFHYFHEGDDDGGQDLEAVVDGIEFARSMNARLGRLIERELVPGEQADSRDDLRAFVRDECWGHHASCTCAVGPDRDPMAVLDGDFRVRGVQRLRVVDASVFPRIPGTFIASTVYMISERAGDVVIREHASAGAGAR